MNLQVVKWSYTMDGKEKHSGSNSNNESKSLSSLQSTTETEISKAPLNIDLNLPTDFGFDLNVILDDEGELSQGNYRALYIGDDKDLDS